MFHLIMCMCLTVRTVHFPISDIGSSSSSALQLFYIHRVDTSTCIFMHKLDSNTRNFMHCTYSYFPPFFGLEKCWMICIGFRWYATFVSSEHIILKLKHYSNYAIYSHAHRSTIPNVVTILACRTVENKYYTIGLWWLCRCYCSCCLCMKVC